MYRTEVTGIGENVWSSNGKLYPSEEEAKDWLRGLASRWTGFDMSRVVPFDTPMRQPVNPKDPLIFQNYRK